MPPVIRYPDLPVSQRREEIVAAMRAHQVVIVAGETGSGKTTQLPKMCLEALGYATQDAAGASSGQSAAPRGMIGCTQPRRVAAMSISRRVAEELQVTWGQEVGCRIRFNDDTSRATQLKFMTDGILLAEVQSDPMLRRYSAIIIDEAHERSLNIDFLLGHLQGLLQKRRDLKVVITSATIDTASFSKAFGGAPVIEVSGRTWPVEIRYAPVEACDDDREPDMVAAAADAVEQALVESTEGDILVFMPTERDIRDAADLIGGRLGSGTEVLALFGRQSNAEQQRIFSPGRMRRVIVSTNIAETSLTIPRIRYVVDSGLARMSRYAARTRTRHLPVEAVSQSSARQRSGRAGRLADGVCIRLYTEEDFEKRQAFTQPEIQRANLAEVILRMKAWRIGDIETFPFIDPPQQASIRAGYALLHELGALDDEHRLTDSGRELARLPVDPTLGRMLLHAREEDVLPEVLVLAAGLGLPDPRERPEEAREAAANAHRVFVRKESDFLTLLSIWVRAEEEKAWQGANALRKFCRRNYLSYVRMREWRDVFLQLSDEMDMDAPSPRSLPEASRSDAVHRSILAGLPAHIALRTGPNTYKIAGNRDAYIFPGSGLHVKGQKPQKQEPKPKDGTAAKAQQPAWIVAGEIVMTSRLFARTCGTINPEWLITVAPHVCRWRWSEPHWNVKSGRVIATECVIFEGLEVRRSRVDYGKVDARAATEIFVREALLDPETMVRQPFHAANCRLRDKLETVFARTRTSRVYGIAENLFAFYMARLENISSLHDLNRVIAASRDPQFLYATEADLAGEDEAVSEDISHFPDAVSLGNSVLPLQYAYKPGEDHDGVTVQVPLPVAKHLSGAQVQWMVPGLREEMCVVLLRALPKNLRRNFLPEAATAREIVREFQPGRGSFLQEFAAFLTKRSGEEILPGDWPAKSLPDYLRPRLEVLDDDQKPVAAGRDYSAIRAEAAKHKVRSVARDMLAAEWEHRGISAWSFPDLPESLPVEEIAGVMVRVWPGLLLRDGQVDVHLFPDKSAADQATPRALRQLAMLVMSKDLVWLQKELRSIDPFTKPSAKPMSFQDALQKVAVKAGASWSTPDVLRESAARHILQHTLRMEPLRPLTKERFDAMITAARRDWPQLIRTVQDSVSQLHLAREALVASARRYPGFEEDLQRLLPADFLDHTPHAQLRHLPRYLKGLAARAEKAHLQPARDAERARLLIPLRDLTAQCPPAKRDALRWMIEEYRISVFCQELGTAHPISLRRLEDFVQ